jgi:hypothetical protein
MADGTDRGRGKSKSTVMAGFGLRQQKASLQSGYRTSSSIQRVRRRPERPTIFFSSTSIKHQASTSNKPLTILSLEQKITSTIKMKTTLITFFGLFAAAVSATDAGSW